LEEALKKSCNPLMDKRKELGLSRIYVAKRMQISEACIERIETGKKKNVNVDEAYGLSVIYNMTLEEIYKLINQNNK